jgi:hypothetical protein
LPGRLDLRLSHSEARRLQGGFNSRLGVGPIETVGNLGKEAGRKEMMDTTAMHFDRATR